MGPPSRGRVRCSRCSRCCAPTARCSPSSPRTSGRCAPTWCAHGTHRYPMLTPIPLPPARSPVPPACGPRAYTTLLHLLRLLHLLQVWGAFWSVPMPPATGAVRFCLHRSLIFTEPLLGCVELPLHELTQDGLCTQWHPLRAKEQRGGDILGEVAAAVAVVVVVVSPHPPLATPTSARPYRAGAALGTAVPRGGLGQPCAPRQLGRGGGGGGLLLVREPPQPSAARGGGHGPRRRALCRRVERRVSFVECVRITCKV